MLNIKPLQISSGSYLEINGIVWYRLRRNVG